MKIVKKEPQPTPRESQESTHAFNVLIALESFTALMSVKQVAELLEKSVDVIYRMARNGYIPAIRVGGEWRFDPSVLARWLAKKDPGLVTAARDIRKAERDTHEAA